MPNRPELEITFLNPKGSLGVTELNIGGSQFFLRAILEIRTQQITALGLFGARLLCGIFGPMEMQLVIVRLLHFDVIPTRDATIVRQQATDLALDDAGFGERALVAMLLEFGQTRFHSLA